MSKARDVVVRFVADTREFLRGTDNVSDAYRDMARGADRVADEGEDSARRIARAYDKAGRSVATDAKKAQAKTSQAFGDAGREAGNEFAQNIGESISSGDVSGLLSGTVGGLAGTFGAGGPLGLALAGVAAVGVTAFQTISGAAEKARAAAQSAFDDLHDQTTRSARLNTILEDRFGGTLEGFERIQRYADASGVSVEAITDALVSGGSQARQLASHFEDILRTEYETTGAISSTTSILIGAQGDLNDRADAMERASRAAVTEKNALAVSEGILRRSASYYAARGSAYAPGGSVYSSQVPRYTGGKRS